MIVEGERDAYKEETVCLAPGRPDGTSRPDVALTSTSLLRPAQGPTPTLPPARGNPRGLTHGCAPTASTTTGYAMQCPNLLLQYPDETFATYI